MEQFKWDIKVSPVNWILVKEVLKVFVMATGVVFFVLGTLVLLEGCPRAVTPVELKYPILLVSLTIFLGVAFILVFWRGGYAATFSIDESGIGFATHPGQVRKNKVVSYLLLGLGIISGKPGIAGIGILGSQGQNAYIAWRDVRKLSFYPSHGAITLHGGVKGKFIVFCPKEKYQHIAELIKGRCPAK